MPAKISFIDQAKIFVKAGDGGDGKISFNREKYKPKGGPDGGDGGNGGSIILVGSKDETSLLTYRYRKHFRAEDGKSGGGKNKKGPQGQDMYLTVPLGTLVKDIDTGEIRGEILHDKEEWVMEKGGKGGVGNVRFASSTNRAPRQSTPGEKHEGHWVQLELKLLADVGIVGFPNAGKSTLLKTMTNAKPKIGNYAFTTLSPNLGVLKVKEKSIRVGDIPGIIEGAHEGHGLGFEFLKHIQRNKVLLFVISADPKEPNKPEAQFEILRDEINKYDEEILKRCPILVALNKIDLSTKTKLNKSIEFFAKIKLAPLLISCKNGTGIEALAEKIHDTM
jgi:GTP-binding protein